MALAIRTLRLMPFQFKHFRTVPWQRRGAAAISGLENKNLLEVGIAMLIKKGVFDDDEDMSYNLNRLRNYSNKALDKTRERLTNLMRHEHDEELKPQDLHTFTHDEYPGDWSLYMINHPETLVQRYQRSGLCYLHAPIVTQYYAIWHTKLKQRKDQAVKEGLEKDHHMIDLTAYILKHFDPKALKQHIFNDQGGDSHKALQSFLQPGAIVASKAVEDAPRFLSEYGPALVSGFTVFADFRNPQIHHHYGKPRGKIEGGHAMVLVGTRTDAKGKLYLLLQNWWLNKQFVEIDVDYFKACGASLWFVETPQTEVPDTFLTHVGHFLQTESLQLMESINEM